jgi:hypothetical protein
MFTHTYTFTFIPNDDPDEYPACTVADFGVIFDSPGDAIEAITGFSHFDRNPVYDAFDRRIEAAIERGDTSVTIEYSPAIVRTAR